MSQYQLKLAVSRAEREALDRLQVEHPEVNITHHVKTEGLHALLDRYKLRPPPTRRGGRRRAPQTRGSAENPAAQSPSAALDEAPMG